MIHNIDLFKLFIWIVFCFSDGIEYLRIIRDPTPNQYMCLIKFKSQVRNSSINNLSILI